MQKLYLILFCCLWITATQGLGLTRLRARLSGEHRPATQLLQLAEIVERQGRSIQTMNQAVYDLQQQRLKLLVEKDELTRKLGAAALIIKQLRGEKRILASDLMRAKAQSA